jgi:DNA (cytosine-5)-methyltransferase 1
MSKKNAAFKFIDLFAGIGGFHHAMAGLGGECVLACEIDKECRKVYESTFGKNFIFADNIRKLTRQDIDNENTCLTSDEINKMVPDHDIICGGFPCQPFSKSGEQLGVKDKTRGTLFFDIVQIIEAKKPKYFFLENVRNLAGPRHLETWKIIIDTLQGLGYRVSSTPLIFSPHLLPPNLGGAPQVRERVFIIGAREDIENGEILNLATFNEMLIGKKFWNPDKWKISDLLDADSDIENLELFFVSKSENVYLEAWDYFIRNIEVENLPGFPMWAFAFQSAPELNDAMASWETEFRIKNSTFYSNNKKFIDGWKKMKWGEEKITVSEFPISRQKLEWQARKHHPTQLKRTLQDLVIQFRPSGIRVKPPSYLPALVAITQTSVVGPLLRKGASEYRKLTPIEAGRLQGMPDEVYKNSTVSTQAAYKQLGNAVNVGIIKRAAGILLGQYEFTAETEQLTMKLYAK